MHLAVLFTYLAASAAIASAAAIPKAEENAKFIAASHGKQASSHYAAQPWLAPITGQASPHWDPGNPFAPPGQSGDPSLDQDYQTSRKGEPVL